ncbi:4-(cytidine 5'-diphospho)-2-C-methyl-D-erythritol kinase [Caldinitratiruptor microaerophilus]|uniref:4-diphosphocytidyl-2-C-methyl-D-erythritol kinase n=1 Tax=Caldinitratiruptor microaerophilus TaxID=671077 RepID=A0AA35CMD6_9FIRM|nr:4-(cytidine 5'-diphospho)-2-C-methyl-D-erythritol kinase [Caldinitratiruptor microaerophilus]BDG61994.1 4-diphosphocytidyl-2-C-methyl-D-erythritol kinase [Caldinitratiruptor microaerophilus]
MREDGPPAPGAIRLEARAKLNLVLEVVGRRPDGYHEIRSVIAPLDLADTVTVERLEEPAGSLELEVDPPGVVGEADNLALRAARLMRDAAGVPDAGARIRIAKRIPVAAGLGGGSTDAAAVLLALNRLWGLGWPAERLQALGARLGADVPACLRGVLGETVLAEGVGERVTTLPPAPRLHVVLATPEATWPGPKTRTVYAAYRPPGIGARAEQAVAALRRGDTAGLLAAVANDLEPGAAALVPAIRHLREAFLSAGAPVVAMAGAGPTVFALAPDPALAERLAAAARPLARAIHVTATGDVLP